MTKRIPASGEELPAIGIGTFGPLDLDSGIIRGTPKPAWSGTDLRFRFSNFSVPLAIDTDVNAAALGERRWGAGEGHVDLIYITVGTGIGVGTLVEVRAGAPYSDSLEVRVAGRADPLALGRPATEMVWVSAAPR